MRSRYAIFWTTEHREVEDQGSYMRKPGIRCASAEALGELFGVRTLEPGTVISNTPAFKPKRGDDDRVFATLICVLIGDSQSDVRAAATEALARIDRPRTVEFLKDLIEDDAFAEDRRAAADALERLHAV
jgi:HEAT repeat protein